ncbi:resolvase domain protein [Acidimicrobium ferrooxidans DSM 10331]|uniref:Resolvase domain protein n=1 Tax=Acidimicrobium ferrooxidans (strain DSM 10331 / JCM 15462 / NBRC 103882 / ICP) TaxID=525909 RepID=C7M0Q5_ACIFD|nr:recombinase family protein [Acidimicrobium ferrooxidans]ACU54563.1 resolvase domain protein [Acidimicrobium ferrooxidans DSM 10331]
MSEASGRVVGYVHVSSVDRSVERQLVGVHTDRVFVDHVSGARVDRPALRDLIAYLREGDEVVVHSLDRSARNLDDLRALVPQLNDKGVTVRFVTDNMAVRPGHSDPLSTLRLSVAGVLAH